MSEAMLLSERKAYGAYYTPGDAAHYMASWALRAASDVLLEPSVGDGQFILAAQEVASARGWSLPTFLASELNPTAASDVVARGLVAPDEIVLGDFLASPIRLVDAAIGNPPYVRLRALPVAQARAASRAALTDIGEPMQSSGSVWMPFVARAARFLRPGGRLALVLPWDFTYVRYARPLWEHLARNFGALRVVRVRQRLFPDISQDVLLLFADDKGGQTRVVEFEAHGKIGDLVMGTPEVRSWVPIDRIVSGERAFQEALLPVGLLDVLNEAAAVTQPVRERVSFNIGYVSGDKDFFHPTKESGLPEEHLLPAVTNARRLRGGGLYTSALPAEAQSLLWLPDEDLTPAESRYERLGRKAGVHKRYKCAIRDPWYMVPGVYVPDLLLSVFAQRPILMVNDGGHVASNSLLCGYLHEGEDAADVAASWYNSLTLLNAELEVHSLGGGVLVLVPNEAGNVRIARSGVVPSSVLAAVTDALNVGDLEGAYGAGDDAIAARLGTDALDLIRRGIDVLERWRVVKAPAVTT